MYTWRITYTTESADDLVVASRLRVDTEDYMLFGSADGDKGSDVRWVAPRSCVQSVTRLTKTDNDEH